MPNLLHGVQLAAMMLQAQTAPPSTVEVADELRVEWRVQTYTGDTQVVRYEQGVKATFGPTILYCDTLELNFQTKTGVATGNIRLVDPEGELTASSLSFNWQDKTGTAVDVLIKLEGIRLDVASVRITPTRWILSRTDIRASRYANPDFAMRARSLTIEPGRQGVVKDARFAFYGLRLPAIPVLSFSLDRRVEGWRIPSLSIRRRGGLGVTWSSGFLLGDQTSLSAQTSIFPNVLPYTSVAYSWSKVAAGKAASFVRPRNELDDPFLFSYIDSIRVRRPTQEAERAKETRQSLAVMSTWNQEALARLASAPTVTKPMELVGELGGEVASFGGYGQLRLQRIRPNARAADINRAAGWTTIVAPALPIARNLEFRGRLDGFGTVRGGQRYGWARAAGFLVAEPASWLRLAVGYARGAERGKPDFEFDRLAVRESWFIRTDFDSGNYRASAILKYSPISRKWFDTELAFSFVAGSFEPFIRTRVFPREVTIGVNLRVSELLGRLTKRNIERTKAGSRPSLPSSKDLMEP